jgi:branched-chain amino acid transport system substrate-binding protein
MRKFTMMRGAWAPGLLAIGMMTLGIPSPVTAGAPTGAPPEFKIGHVDFLSGPAAGFGVPGRKTAEWLVDKWNKEGGIRGVKVKILFVDEAGTPDKVVTEYRRLAVEEKVHAITGYTLSANCLAIRPVAEELKVLTIIHVCGTHRLNEEFDLKYVFRTANTDTGASVMAARYILSIVPNLKTIAGLNEGEPGGKGSWDNFKSAVLRFKPDVKVVAELRTNIQAGEYSAEISKLLAAQPDVVHSSLWAAGLVTFVKQAEPRGLFKNRQVLFSTGEQGLQDLKKDMPDGVVVTPQSTPGYFLSPDPEKNHLQKEYVEAMQARVGRYPDYPQYRTYHALAGLKAAYERAIDQAGGRWPTTEQVIKAFEALTWTGPLGSITMRRDHQGVHGGLIGLTKFNPKYGFPTLERTMELPADQVQPPLGMRSQDWIALGAKPRRPFPSQRERAGPKK